MILVDTSVWVDHLRRTNAILVDQLRERRVLAHPFVIGELALGGTRADVLENLLQLPASIVASAKEVLGFIKDLNLTGRGIGYVDVHLLASARLTGDTSVWTFDKQLQRVALEMGLRAALAP